MRTYSSFLDIKFKQKKKIKQKAVSVAKQHKAPQKLEKLTANPLLCA